MDSIRTWKINFFQTQRGDHPVKNFIEQQDKKTYAKILLSITLLQKGGPFLKPPYIKKVRDKLYELRISGAVAIRILYAFHKNEYYLLHAFKKKTQKAPTKELRIAIDRMRDLI